MTANIERMVADHCAPIIEELDVEISKTLDKLRELQRRRVVIAMHLAVSEVSDATVSTILHAADTHDYTEA